MRHLIDWQYYDDETWESLLDRALWHYNSKQRWHQSASGKSIGLLFFNPSLRTRTSMELAAHQLGAFASTLTVGQGTWGFAWQAGQVMDGPEAEHIKEAVGVLSRYYDALGVRVFASLSDYNADRSERLIHTFKEASSVPVINLESAFYHPCQALSDAAAMTSFLAGKPAGKKFTLAWTYHPKALPMAVPNSALLTATRLGMDVTLACPDEYKLDPAILSLAQKYAQLSGGAFSHTTDLDKGIKEANIVYAKAWSGTAVYNDKAEEEQSRFNNKSWRISQSHMASTNNGAFMHCLPVRRNVVVDDAVLDSDRAIHLLQAEFRLHAQKAILEYIWNLPV